jgi:hypothetical protein
LHHVMATTNMPKFGGSSGDAGYGLAGFWLKMLPHRSLIR